MIHGGELRRGWLASASPKASGDKPADRSSPLSIRPAAIPIRPSACLQDTL